MSHLQLQKLNMELASWQTANKNYDLNNYLIKWSSIVCPIEKPLPHVPALNFQVFLSLSFYKIEERDSNNVILKRSVAKSNLKSLLKCPILTWSQCGGAILAKKFPIVLLKWT